LTLNTLLLVDHLLIGLLEIHLGIIVFNISERMCLKVPLFQHGSSHLQL